MDCYVGIDLGSTTTKSIYMDENENILGRGITNSRSDYELACEVASEEAGINARFGIFNQSLLEKYPLEKNLPLTFNAFFKAAHFERQLVEFEKVLNIFIDRTKHGEQVEIYREAIKKIIRKMEERVYEEFNPKNPPRSDFFRDLAATLYMEEAENLAEPGNNKRLTFESLAALFDKSILVVEGKNFSKYFDEYLYQATHKTLSIKKYSKFGDNLKELTEKIAHLKFNILNNIGTGYGRQTIPFPPHQIRSEILCHGLGAHYMFPKTRTVLDIGGQDTKAIQVDENGIVTSFQMNDRCAAGCGRYLGYIADEMNVGVQELGPMALNSSKTIKINSTCTVFAGAELRERLALGEKREDILSGLHRAMILRAMSLLARSGGIFDQFTFTGGVARNMAATGALLKLVQENYGELTTNISADSIYTGALGAALFAKRDRRGDLAHFDVRNLRGNKGKAA